MVCVFLNKDLVLLNEEIAAARRKLNSSGDDVQKDALLRATFCAETQGIRAVFFPLNFHSAFSAEKYKPGDNVLRALNYAEP